MTRQGCARQIVSIALAAIGISCGGGGGNGGGNAGGNPGGPIRSDATGLPHVPDVRQRSHGDDGEQNHVRRAGLGTFDSGSKKSTVTTMFANGAPCSTNITSYDSVADFIDEVHVVPPILRSTSNTNTNSGGCGRVTSSTPYRDYDGSATSSRSSK